MKTETDDVQRTVQWTRDLLGLREDLILEVIASGKAEIVETFPGGRRLIDVLYPCEGRPAFRVKAIVSANGSRVLSVLPPAFTGSMDAIDMLRKAFAPMFRDAFGRMTARTGRKEQDFQRVFSPILEGIADAFAPSFGGASKDTMQEFIRRYIGSLALRWNGELAADAELERGLRELSERACRF